MLNIGPGELLAISVIALIVLGPEKLPEMIRTVGRVVGELRRISSGFQTELRSAIDDQGLDEVTGGSRTTRRRPERGNGADSQTSTGRSRDPATTADTAAPDASTGDATAVPPPDDGATDGDATAPRGGTD